MFSIFKIRFVDDVLCGRTLLSILCTMSLVGTVLGAEAVTLDLPWQHTQSVPPQLASHPRQMIRLDGVGYLEIYLKAAAAGEGLLVTLVFNEETDAGPALFCIPSLSDPGYLSGSSGETEYSGWRDAGLLLPAALLTKGDNSIVLSSSTPSAFVRDATLQIKAQATALPTTEGIAIGETPDLAPH